jgi:hypothetical protein
LWRGGRRPCGILEFGRRRPGFERDVSIMSKGNSIFREYVGDKGAVWPVQMGPCSHERSDYGPGRRARTWSPGIDQTPNTLQPQSMIFYHQPGYTRSYPLPLPLPRFVAARLAGLLTLLLDSSGSTPNFRIAMIKACAESNTFLCLRKPYQLTSHQSSLGLPMTQGHG